jgi:hypothetical protein
MQRALYGLRSKLTQKAGIPPADCRFHPPNGWYVHCSDAEKAAAVHRQKRYWNPLAASRAGGYSGLNTQWLFEPSS